MIKVHHNACVARGGNDKIGEEIAEQIQCSEFVADKGYDSDKIRKNLEIKGIKSTIPYRKNRKTINKIFDQVRQRIFEYVYNVHQKFSGTFELDESYFGAKRVRGKRGRGAAGKTPVFGILKRDGNVYVEVVENCSKEQLMPIIQGKILEGSTINTDGWRAYDGLIFECLRPL